MNIPVYLEGGTVQPLEDSDLALETIMDLTLGVSSFGYSFASLRYPV